MPGDNVQSRKTVELKSDGSNSGYNARDDLDRSRAMLAKPKVSTHDVLSASHNAGALEQTMHTRETSNADTATSQDIGGQNEKPKTKI